LCYFRVLIDASAAASNRAYGLAFYDNRKAASENHEPPAVTHMDAESLASRAGDFGVIRSREPGAGGGKRLVNGNVNTRYFCAVHPMKAKQVGSRIDDGDVHVDSDFVSLGLGGLEHHLGAF